MDNILQCLSLLIPKKYASIVDYELESEIFATLKYPLYVGKFLSLIRTSSMQIYRSI